jgi:hypothetical protein
MGYSSHWYNYTPDDIDDRAYFANEGWQHGAKHGSYTEDDLVAIPAPYRRTWQEFADAAIEFRQNLTGMGRV